MCQGEGESTGRVGVRFARDQNAGKRFPQSAPDLAWMSMRGTINKIKTKVESRWRRTARWAQWTIIVLVVLLVVIRLALPGAVKYYVNRQLSRIPDYSGKVDRIHMHLWRGAYEIDRLSIVKTDGKVPAPLFSASSIDLSVQWRELFHGSIVGEVLLDHPQVNFVTAPNPQESQNGAKKPWTSTLESLFPFDINRIEIKDGAVHFQNFHNQDKFDIYVTNLFSVATNLTNSRKVTQKLPAGLNASGETLGHGLLTVNLKMNPLDAGPTFEVTATLTNVNMVQINDFLRSYGKLDVARGTFNLFVSAAASEGNYQGYVKVLFENLDIFQWEKDRKKNILDLFWQAIAGALSEGFRNHPHDQLATQIPISGSFTNSHVHVFAAVGSLLRNAFIRALIPKIEPQIKLQDVETNAPAAAPAAEGVTATNSVQSASPPKAGEKLEAK
jgi:hypothetical protein